MKIRQNVKFNKIMSLSSVCFGLSNGPVIRSWGGGGGSEYICCYYWHLHSLSLILLLQGGSSVMWRGRKLVEKGEGESLLLTLTAKQAGTPVPAVKLEHFSYFANPIPIQRKMIIALLVFTLFSKNTCQEF